MTDDLRARVKAVADDRHSGASQLLPEVLAILVEARAAGESALDEAVSLVCAAQPAMGSVWNAALAALSSTDDEDRLSRFSVRSRRATYALARVARDLFADPPARPWRLVTHSASGSVATVVHVIASSHRVEVECTEGRPVLEGRQMAVALRRAGAVVRVWTDAGVQQALQGADALLLGADAVTAQAFVNKSGSSGLAAAAMLRGVPVYLLASRDKFVPRPVIQRLRLPESDPREVWDAPPREVAVRNPYYEWVPLTWVSALVTDAGVVGPADAGEFCRANERFVSEEMLRRIRVGERG